MRVSRVCGIAAWSLLALCGSAGGQMPPPGSDVVGIYSGDFSGPTGYSWFGTGTATVFIVFSGLTHAGIAGWEMSVTRTGQGASLTQVSLLGVEPVSLWPGTLDFEVGLGVPMTVPGPQGTFAVAALTFQVDTTEATYLYIQSNRYAEIWDGPAVDYADAADVGVLVRAQAASGSYDVPVFGFNADPPWTWLPVAERTWGGVKGMYR